MKQFQQYARFTILSVWLEMPIHATFRGILGVKMGEIVVTFS